MLLTPCSTDCRECQPKRLRRRSMSREPDRYLLPFQTARSLNPPDRVTLDRSVANTRSCVGVKSLMSVPGSVKPDGFILWCIFLLLLSMSYEIIGRRTRETFFQNCARVSRRPTPISCTQTKHRFCTACPQITHLERGSLGPSDARPMALFEPPRGIDIEAR